jgi:hypothetical protein
LNPPRSSSAPYTIAASAILSRAFFTSAIIPQMAVSVDFRSS